MFVVFFLRRFLILLPNYCFLHCSKEQMWPIRNLLRMLFFFIKLPDCITHVYLSLLFLLSYVWTRKAQRNDGNHKWEQEYYTSEEIGTSDSEFIRPCWRCYKNTAESQTNQARDQKLEVCLKSKSYPYVCNIVPFQIPLLHYFTTAETAADLMEQPEKRRLHYLTEGNYDSDQSN